MSELLEDSTEAAVVPMEAPMRDDPADAVKSRRLTRDDWLSAARKILVKSGIDDVKVDRLAKKMKSSRGSFYWHFKSHADLVQTLLQDWEVRNQVVIAQTRDRWEEGPVDLADVGLVFMRENAIWLDPEVNWATQALAMRLWARKSKAVEKAVLRIDEQWLDLLTSMFLRSGYEKKESRVRARVIYFHFLGHYSFLTDEMIRENEELMPTFYKVMVGGEPSERYLKLMDESLVLFRSKTKAGRRRAKAS